MDLGSNPSSLTYKQVTLGKCGPSQPAFSAIKWDNDSHLTGLLRSLSEMASRTLSKSPVSAHLLLWVSCVWLGEGT